MDDGRGEKEPEWLAGGGEMSKAIRSIDWSKTSLGPLESWPQSLRTTVSLCLASNFPISIAWGKEFAQIYNDGYWPICGAKHPHSMGQDFRECWASAWPVIGDAFERAVRGEKSFLENQRMFVDRNGYLEEAFFTFSFSPIRDESGGLGGLFHPVTETTARMLSERRVRALRDIGAGAGKAQSITEACALAMRTLADYELDLPFVLLYRIDEDGRHARLAGATGIARDHAAAPATVDLHDPRAVWPLRATENGQAVDANDLAARFDMRAVGPYPEGPAGAVLLPLTLPGTTRPMAVLVAGVSSRLPRGDDAYRGFFEMLGAGVTTALANAHAYQEERRRSEALSELDRVKTAFFSNVSHELRTPLTLILGPLEDMLAGRRGELAEAISADAQIMYRSARRLLKLVNTLLDFSRIEADRTTATFAPTDLATLTADVSSELRAAVERAGLELVVDCPPVDEPVFVDHDMWEKIVLNLLSNAFKYTFEGRIDVTLRKTRTHAVLEVRDTGTGIAPDHLPKIFDRFHRVEGARGRSHEGTGIGLALVSELARFHGGVVEAESVVGKGSTFRVRIPLGNAHLDPARVREQPLSRDTRADVNGAFADEAASWTLAPPAVVATADRESEPPPAAFSTNGAPARAPSPERRRRIVLADDNADMRDYVSRLLVDRYEVIAVGDGVAALDAVKRHRPDLLLSDIMMPAMDGIALVRAIRADATLRSLPIILLSARAGDEARVDGIEQGADDYLIKPFSARELTARIHSQLQMVDVRKQVLRHEVLEQELRRAVKMRDEFLSVASHELRTPLTTVALQSTALLAEVSRGETARPLDSARLRKRADVLVRQTVRLEHLVDALLDVSRLAGGRMPLAPAEVDIRDAVRGVIERIDSCGRERIQLHFDGIDDEEHARAVWDRVRVEQILTNLLSNAVKFGEDKPIDVSVDAAGPDVTIRIRDQGIGIASEDKGRIFGQFERAVSERRFGGLGLGLWIVRALLDAMGGRLELDSELGRGAQFTVTLPRSTS